MNSEDVARLFPQAPPLRPGLRLFALLGTDGSQTVLTGSRAAALASTWEHTLQTVSGNKLLALREPNRVKCAAETATA